MNKFLFLTILLILRFSTVQAETANDIVDIKKTAMDYMESWYQGDAKKMRESLHPNLAKRSLKVMNGKIKLSQTTASDMIDWTRIGFGKNLWSDTHQIEVVVLDLYQNIASVKIVTPDYREYLHLLKINKKWVAVNALYEKK
ncbi:MAG: nuclear transport factor 2 family protein [Desulfobacula sp.]|nr:nuclear transport factor 2 family protein [Desulfobacula sp.]